MFSKFQTLLICAGLAFFYMGCAYATRMWLREHYQHFPLVFGVVAFFLWQVRDDIVHARTEPNRFLAFAWLALTVIVAFVVLLLRSSSMSLIAFLILVTGLYYTTVGWGGLRRALPFLAVLLLVIPLPFRSDEQLILQMQFLASGLAGWLLDAVDQVYFRQGVVLVTEQKQYLTEEACSGIRSLFSSLAAIALYGAICRYSLVRHLFNLVQVVGWVIIGNALRVAIVVYVADHYSDWISHGFGHELLGILVFLFIMAMAISTDRLVEAIKIFKNTFYPADDAEFTLADDDANATLAHTSANRDIPSSWSAGAAKNTTTNAAANKVAGGEKGKVASNAADANGTAANTDAYGTFIDGSFADHAGVRAAATPVFSTKQTAILCAGFLVVFCISLRVFQVRFLSKANDWWNTPVAKLDPPAQDILPKAIGDWEFVSFENIHRGQNQIRAEDSYVWTMTNGSQTALVSIDTPFQEWHDLTNCYLALGWKAASEYQLSSAEVTSRSLDEKSFTRVRLTRGNNHGLVLFSSVDRHGQEVLPAVLTPIRNVNGFVQQTARVMAASLGFGAETQLGIAGNELPANTIQVYCAHPAALEPAQIEQLHQLFFDARKILTKYLNSAPRPGVRTE